MAGNSIGQLFRVTTFGESHGLALGCIIDGVPPGLALTEADLQGILTVVAQERLVTRQHAASLIRLKFCLACLMASQREPVLAC